MGDLCRNLHRNERFLHLFGGPVEKELITSVPSPGFGIIRATQLKAL